MKRQLHTLLVGMGLGATVLSASEGMAQVTLKNNYKNFKSATIGTFQGISFREAGFSGLFPIPNTGGKEFWTVSDRGVNVDAANANPATCRPGYDKIYGFATYAPKIHRIKLAGDSIQILQTISIKRPNGSPATGLLNPTGYGSTASEFVSTDTVLNCANIPAKTVAKDVWGIDSEGITVDKDGNFWICEEGGPTVWKVNPNGVVIKRYTPYANLPGKQAQDVQIDTVFRYRKNNRGFEGVAVTPNGKVYAIIQSPILYPTKAVGEATRVHRILEIDPTTSATRTFAYLNDGSIGTGANEIRLSDWKIGDLAAINDTTFLVIEAGARGTSDVKKIYKISLNSATVVTSGLYGGKTLEALVDSAGLASNSIKPVKKTLVVDLLANGWPAELDKSEGLAILNDSTIVVGNDNDYGQASPTQNGVATATTKLSNVFVYGLMGASKLVNFVPQLGAPKDPFTGPSSSKSPYLTPVGSGTEVVSIMTAGDSVGTYKMAGTPDGLGAYDNEDGTFTVLINHEFGNTQGGVRAHGSIGAFVSKWVIKKSDLSVVSGSDLIQRVHLWNPVSKIYEKKTIAFNRFCSADLAEPSAFYNAATAKGTMSRIFMNGEESGNNGKGFAHIATGDSAGVSFELPYLGKMSWENAVASPAPSDKTIVVGLDDSTPGQVYVYVGDKSATGNDIEKAGLTGGKLYGVAVDGLLTEMNASVPAAGTTFTLESLGDIRDVSGDSINKLSNSKGVTNFLRPEDGAWDPKSPNDFYFATTNGPTANSRLWRLRFQDIANPELGGTVSAVLEGSEGQRMLDNLTIDNYGHVLLVEDMGSDAHVGKTWQYTLATDELKLIASHDTTRFMTGGSRFLTINEEASGILDVESILGPGYFIVVDQAHYAIPSPIVEGGQLLTLFNPDTYEASQMVTDISSPELFANGSSVYLFPNPTGNTATISMILDKSEKVIVSVFDMKGNRMSPAIEQNLSSGKQQVTLNTSELENGIYFVQVATSSKTTRIKTVVMH